MARSSFASTDSEVYVDPTYWQRLDHYFWPFDATDKLSNSIFLHKAAFCILRGLALAGLVAVLVLCVSERQERLLAFPEAWGLFTTLGFYCLLTANYACSRLWKFAHFLFELSWCLELTCTLVYWVFFYPMGNRWHPTTEGLLHGGLLFVLFIDYLNNTIYFYRRHLRVMILLALSYILVNIPISLLVYSAYEELSYRDGWTALGVCLELLLLVLSFLAGAQMDRFKYRYMQRPIDDPLMDFEESIYMTQQSDAKAANEKRTEAAETE